MSDTCETAAIVVVSEAMLKGMRRKGDSVKLLLKQLKTKTECGGQCDVSLQEHRGRAYSRSLAWLYSESMKAAISCGTDSPWLR